MDVSQTINIASGVPSIAHQDSIGASDLPTVTRQRYYAIVDILQVFKLQLQRIAAGTPKNQTRSWHAMVIMTQVLHQLEQGTNRPQFTRHS